jgi:hypothetical protein
VPQVDWRDAFAAHVTALQKMHSEAHDALVNWGQWSREGHAYPKVDAPTLFTLWDHRDYDDEDVDPAELRAPPPGYTLITHEEEDVVHSDPKRGERVDILLHQHDCPRPWRTVARVTYYSRFSLRLLPHHAELRDEVFTYSLCNLLLHVEDKLHATGTEATMQRARVWSTRSHGILRAVQEEEDA